MMDTARSISEANEQSTTADSDVAEALSPRSDGARLVAISNRLVLPGQNHAGGLAQALHGLFSRIPGIWLGWSGTTIAGTSPVRHEYDDGRTRYLTLDLPDDLFEQYYRHFANRVLWPLLHGRGDLMDYDVAAYRGYLMVNEHFARLLDDVVQKEDLIWVHDYHLLPLASIARRRHPDNRFGFFFHTPVPAPEILRTLPRNAALFGRLVEYDLIGVQTPADAANLREYLQHEFGAGSAQNDVVALANGRTVRIRVHPVGVDCQALSQLAESDEPLPPDQGGGASAVRSLIGVDRLDYTKGISHRVRALERLLEHHPDLCGQIQLEQIASPSRTELGEYQRLAKGTRQLVERVNRRFRRPGWEPIRYHCVTRSSAELTLLYRRADVGLVTPLRDGMNLVAKEYVAAQDPRDPGVLVLSCFAGAAYELNGAVLVNPHDRDGCADAIHRSLQMPLLERRQRWQAMMQVLRDNDVHHWASGYVSDLAASRSAQRPAMATMRLKRLAPSRKLGGDPRRRSGAGAVHQVPA